MTDQLQRAFKDPDIIRGVVCGLAAALILSYVASVSKPVTTHAVLALLGLAAIIGAYLSVANSKIEPEARGLAAIIGGVVSVGVFVLLSQLYG
jgi:peptidoglycan/LPS O-acetylase OafA/YrhL